MEGNAINPGYIGGGGLSGMQRTTVPGNAPKVVNPSCFGNVEDVCGMSGSAAARVDKVVNRLCGLPPPQPDSAGSIQGDANGLFEATDRQAREIRANLERIFAAVDRLEKNLP